jgi:hypothetical protein
MGCSERFKPDLCTIVNIGVAQCTPTDPAKPKYDLDSIELLGYTCLSPEDFADGKKAARKIMENLN